MIPNRRSAQQKVADFSDKIMPGIKRRRSTAGLNLKD
jgi:hypothetical protein